MSALRGLLTCCKLQRVSAGARYLSDVVGCPGDTGPNANYLATPPVPIHHLSVKSEETIAKIGTVIPSIPDQVNPIPGVNYAIETCFHVGEWPMGPLAGAQTGVHAVTGLTTRFPYFHERNACYNEDAVITDLVEVIPADSEKHSPIDMWLDGFEFPGLPKGENEVYRVKGTRFGETGPSADFFRYRCNFPGVNDAFMFWRKYGTFQSETLPEDQFEAMWMHFFRNPMLDRHELHRGCNLIHGFDLVPDPLLVEQMFYACRRLDYYAMTLRILEAIKDKIPSEPETYAWYMQELAPVMEELGITTPESHKLNIRPEGKGPYPY